jgi:hypothetical protein
MLCFLQVSWSLGVIFSAIVLVICLPVALSP